MHENSIRLLSNLSNAAGAPGDETAIAQIIRSELSDHHITSDSFGNLNCQPATKNESNSAAGSGTSKKTSSKTGSGKILLSAHMDEIGFIVQSIGADGNLKFCTLGGVWSHNLLAQKVTINTAKQKITGVIATIPPHHLSTEARDKLLKPEQMYIDIGAFSREQALEMGVRVGSYAVPASDFGSLANPDLLVGKAFDNRVGVAIAINLMQQAAKHQLDCQPAALFTTQEELGARGARFFLPQIKQAKVIIVLEASPADDYLSTTSHRQCLLGAGPQFRAIDTSAVTNQQLLAYASGIAEQNSIPHQLCVRNRGGTDAAQLQYNPAGAPVLVVGVPARYIHSHNCVIHRQDYTNTIKLLTKLLPQLEKNAG